eukprot:180524_1
MHQQTKSFYIYQCNKKHIYSLTEYQITNGQKECNKQINLDSINDLSMFEIALYPQQNSKKYVSNKLKISVPNPSNISDNYEPNAVLLSSIKAIELNEEKDENIYVYFEMPDNIRGNPIKFKIKYINNDKKEEYISNPFIISKSSIPISFQIITSANINGKQYLSKPSDIITINYMDSVDSTGTDQKQETFPSSLAECTTDDILSILSKWMNDKKIVAHKKQIAAYIKSHNINGDILLKTGRKQFAQNVMSYCGTKKVHLAVNKVYDSLRKYNFFATNETHNALPNQEILDEKEADLIYEEMLLRKKIIKPIDKQQMFDDWSLQADELIKTSERINEKLINECVSLHKFNSNDICNKIKYWIYHDVEYKNNLKNVMGIFAEWSLSGEQILLLSMKNIQIILEKTLLILEFISKETFNIILERLRFWKLYDTDYIKTKTAWEIGSIVYNYPLEKLCSVINDKNALINGLEYIKLYEENKNWMQNITGWHQSEVYQINWVLFKHYTWTKMEIEQRMDEVFPKFVGKQIAVCLKDYLMSMGDVEVLHYKLKNGVDLTDSLTQLQDTLSSKVSDEKKSDEYVFVANDLNVNILKAVQECFALSCDNIYDEEQCDYNLKQLEWICCNCGNRNFRKYIGGRINGDLSVCALCGVSPKEPIFNVSEYDANNEELENKDDEKDVEKDEINKMIEKAVKDNNVFITCEAETHGTICIHIFKLIKQLIIHKQLCFTMNNSTINKNIKMKDIDKPKLKQIFAENKENIQDLFVTSRKTFLRTVTNILSVKTAVSVRLYKAINDELTRSKFTAFHQYLSNVSMKDIMTSYHHILTVHMQANDDLAKQIVFQCFE